MVDDGLEDRKNGRMEDWVIEKVRGESTLTNYIRSFEV